jgi:hypothetical protein
MEAEVGVDAGDGGATQKEVRAAVLDNVGGTRRRAHRWEKTTA